jgi:hypothetical protein
MWQKSREHLGSLSSYRVYMNTTHLQLGGYYRYNYYHYMIFRLRNPLQVAAGDFILLDVDAVNPTDRQLQGFPPIESSDIEFQFLDDENYGRGRVGSALALSPTLTVGSGKHITLTCPVDQIRNIHLPATITWLAATVGRHRSEDLSVHHVNGLFQLTINGIGVRQPVGGSPTK